MLKSYLCWTKWRFLSESDKEEANSRIKGPNDAEPISNHISWFSVEEPLILLKIKMIK